MWIWVGAQMTLCSKLKKQNKINLRFLATNKVHKIFFENILSVKKKNLLAVSHHYTVVNLFCL